MSRQAVLAVEGLPGAGKTALVGLIHFLRPGITVIPELLLPVPPDADRSFFARNDLAKLRAATGTEAAVFDRSWMSTVTYVIAETRWRGEESDPRRVAGNLYPHTVEFPPVCLFIDSPRALALAFASDGLFADLRFRALLRAAYLEIFDEYGAGSVHIVASGSLHEVAPALRHAFSKRTNPSRR